MGLRRRKAGGFLTGLASLLVVLAISGVALAAVVVVYTYSISTTPVSPVFYLQDGPNYASANAMGLFTATESGTPSNVASSTTIDVNTVAGSADVYLLNVLDIYNASSLTAPTHVYVYINGTLPAGVSMYYSSSAITFSGTSVSGTPWITGTQIFLKPVAGVDLNLAFVLTGAATGTGTLGFQYLVT